MVLTLSGVISVLHRMEVSRKRCLFKGREIREGTFDFNNSDQVVLIKAYVDKSAHIFSLSESFLIISALTVKKTVPRDICPKAFLRGADPFKVPGGKC